MHLKYAARARPVKAVCGVVGGRALSFRWKLRFVLFGREHVVSVVVFTTLHLPTITNQMMSKYYISFRFCLIRDSIIYKLSKLLPNYMQLQLKKLFLNGHRYVTCSICTFISVIYIHI